ncbi:MAG TPA: cytochrome c [Candidatus Binataceae bacterium]|jgi:mono/diheme cytochrome c family protein|nr:cytochrome c [Candidatus Binataceae bacterium]
MKSGERHWLPLLIAVALSGFTAASAAAQCPGANGCRGKSPGGGIYSQMTGAPTPPPSESASGNPGMSSLFGASSDDTAEPAPTLYQERCASCHGKDGHGDGPGALALKPKPINFHNQDWQHSVSDDQIAKAIVEGGAAVGLSKQMPDNPDLEDNPKEITALVAYIRAFGK